MVSSSKESVFGEEVELGEDGTELRSLEFLVKNLFKALSMAAFCSQVIKNVQIHHVFVGCGYPLPDLLKPRVERALESTYDVDVGLTRGVNDHSSRTF